MNKHDTAVYGTDISNDGEFLIIDHGQHWTVMPTRPLGRYEVVALLDDTMPSGFGESVEDAEYDLALIMGDQQ